MRTLDGIDIDRERIGRHAGTTSPERAEGREALIERVRDRVRRHSNAGPAVPAGWHGEVRARTAPLITGLFPPEERIAIHRVVERSMVVLTECNVERVLREERWPHTAEVLADMVLRSLGLEPLSASSPEIDGLSQDATCYLTARALAETVPLRDVVVHEAAHLLHTVRPETIGLAHRAGRERLVDVAYRRRELFAYSCEALGWLSRHFPTRRERIAAFERHVEAAMPIDSRVDPDEYRRLVRTALSAPRGWSTIARHCADR